MSLDTRFNEIADARRDVLAVRDELQRLRSAGGGGTSGGMEIWHQSVETRLSELRHDVRQVLQALIAGMLLLLGAFATGFVILNAKADTSTERTLSKLDAMTTQISVQNERLARIEAQAIGQKR